MARKRKSRDGGRYKPPSEWEVNRSIFRPGIAAAGSIIYKGVDAATGEHRFLLRHKITVSGIETQPSRSITAPTASAAEVSLHVWVAELRGGRVALPTATTLTEYVENVWLPDCLAREIAGATYYTYVRLWDLRVKPYVGHLRIHELTPEVAKGLLTQWRTGAPITRTYTRNGRPETRTLLPKLSPRSIRNARNFLAQLTNSLVDEKRLPSNPMARRKGRSRKEKREQATGGSSIRQKYWTADEVALFWSRGAPYRSGALVLEYPSPRRAEERAKGMDSPRVDRMAPYGAAMCFTFGGLELAFGLRPGEACAAKWEDLRKVDGTWYLQVATSIGRPDARQLLDEGCPAWDRTPTKTGVQADVPDLSGYVEQYLLPFRDLQERLAADGELVNPDGYILAQPNGRFYTPDSLSVKWGHFQRGIGLARPIPPYWLRHTHATLLLEAGVSIQAISARLRHKDPGVTASVYAHVTNRLNQRTAAKVSAVGLVPLPEESVPPAPEAPLAESTPADMSPPSSEPERPVGQAGVLDMEDWRRRRRA